MAIVNATLRADGVGHLELNRPEVRNAINLEMVRALHARSTPGRSEPTAACVVLSGAGGKAFAGGADIAELRERTHREAFFGVNQSALPEGGGLSPPRRSPRSTATPSAAGWSWRWPAICGWRRARRRWACPR